MSIPEGAQILLKSGTQGFDLEVLRGASEDYSQLRWDLYENAADFLEAIREMRSYGFYVAAMSPVSFHGRGIVGFDCLMIKSSRTSSSEDKELQMIGADRYDQIVGSQLDTNLNFSIDPVAFERQLERLLG
jgi:hypothetical protein